MAEPTAKPRPNDLLPERFSEPTPIAPDDTPANRRYVPIMPQGGRYHSDVPDLDLAVLEERLRFYYSGAEVPDADAELTMLTRMVEERTTRLDEAERAAAPRPSAPTRHSRPCAPPSAESSPPGA